MIRFSDAILDALLEQDPMSRVACETCTTTGIVMVMGEISTKAYVDIRKLSAILFVRLDIQEVNMDLTLIHAVLLQQSMNSPVTLPWV